jgi:4-oxalocrotonate tautomerase
MPIIQITVVEGRDPEDIKRCVKSVARVVHETLASPLATIRVTVLQVPPAFWSVGDQTRDEIDADRKAAAAASS